MKKIKVTFELTRSIDGSMHLSDGMMEIIIPNKTELLKVNTFLWIKYLFEVQDLWDRLGDIPIDEDECIEEEFLHFGVGTHREDIWLWFEDEFNISVTEDLMFN